MTPPHAAALLLYDTVILWFNVVFSPTSSQPPPYIKLYGDDDINAKYKKFTQFNSCAYIAQDQTFDTKYI